MPRFFRQQRDCRDRRGPSRQRLIFLYVGLETPPPRDVGKDIPIPLKMRNRLSTILPPSCRQEQPSFFKAEGLSLPSSPSLFPLSPAGGRTYLVAASLRIVSFRASPFSFFGKSEIMTPLAKNSIVFLNREEPFRKSSVDTPDIRFFLQCTFLPPP